MSSENSSNVRVLASPSSWIESSAVDQCHAVAALPGMESVAGMADLHPGKAAPIGCAALSHTLYPHLVGSDIGCGVGVWPLTVKKADTERMARRLVDLDAEIDEDDPTLDGLDPQIWARHRHGLGTTGRGNHFAEIARVEVAGDAIGSKSLGASPTRSTAVSARRCSTTSTTRSTSAADAFYIGRGSAGQCWTGSSSPALGGPAASSSAATPSAPRPPDGGGAALGRSCVAGRPLSDPIPARLAARSRTSGLD